MLALHWPFCLPIAPGVEVYLTAGWTGAAVAYLWGPVVLPIMWAGATAGYFLIGYLDRAGLVQAQGIAGQNLRRARGLPYTPGNYQNGLLRQVEYLLIYGLRGLVAIAPAPLGLFARVLLGEILVTVWTRAVPFPGSSSVRDNRARIAAALGTDMVRIAELLDVVMVTALVGAYELGGLVGFVTASAATIVIHGILQGLNAARMESERRQRRLLEVQEELARRERLAMIGQTASTVFHQIGRHHGAIGLYAHLLMRAAGDHPDGRGDTVRAHAERIQRSTTEANRVMNELLRFGQDRALNLYEHRWNDVVEEAVAECAPRAAARGVRLAVRCVGDAILTLDKHKTKQVIGNLLDNAIDATPPDGAVDVIAHGTPERVEVAVRDRGAGVAEAVAARLFAPFVTTKPDGIGLGLVLARELAEAHGGAIVWRNPADGGAEFTVRLPRRPPLTRV